jgi:hypothetical protein
MKLPLERLEIEPMASGNQSLVLTEAIDWESFPDYAAAVLRCVAGTLVHRAQGPDKWVWTVTVREQLFWLAYDEYLGRRVSIDAQDAAASALLPDIRQILLTQRANN